MSWWWKIWGKDRIDFGRRVCYSGEEIMCILVGVFSWKGRFWRWNWRKEFSRIFVCEYLISNWLFIVRIYRGDNVLD